MIRAMLFVWLLCAALVLGASWLLGEDVIRFGWKSVTGLWLILLSLFCTVAIVCGLKGNKT